MPCPLLPHSSLSPLQAYPQLRALLDRSLPLIRNDSQNGPPSQEEGRRGRRRVALAALVPEMGFTMHGSGYPPVLQRLAVPPDQQEEKEEEEREAQRQQEQQQEEEKGRGKNAFQQQQQDEGGKG